MENLMPIYPIMEWRFSNNVHILKILDVQQVIAFPERHTFSGMNSRFCIVAKISNLNYCKILGLGILKDTILF